MHTPLYITNSPNCQPHPWHPSVVYIPNGWSGHHFWMAQTPFPPKHIEPYSDRYELPCIHFSDDGIHWTPIDPNPIEDLLSNEIDAHNYYSDPHLVLKDGKLECYFRFTFLKDRQLVGNKTLLLKKTSSDGIHWSEKTIIADLRNEDDVKTWGNQIISPAVVWDGKQYICWYVDRSSYLNGRKINRSTSHDGINWSNYQTCSLNDIDPWHIDVQYYDNKFQLIVYDMCNLYWFDSIDGLSFHFVSKILSPTNYFIDFYSVGLYRACSVLVKDKILVYFSAKNAQRTSIGILQTTDRMHFTPINGISQTNYFKNYIYPQKSWKNCKRWIKHNLRECRIIQ